MTSSNHYDDVIMTTMASQITSLTVVYSIVYSDADQRKHQSSASLAFVRGIHRGPVNSPHKWPVTRKMCPFDDVIMCNQFPRYWPFVWPVNSPHKGLWRGALMFSLICARINGWANNGDAGDLRRHIAHYDVIVMNVAVPDVSYRPCQIRRGRLRSIKIFPESCQSANKIFFIHSS